MSKQIPKRIRDAVKIRSDGLCEFCKSAGDWRGLVMAHVRNKKMGGSRKVETEDDVLHLCHRCHNNHLHHLREV